MLVVKKVFMYVSKPFGGEGAGGEVLQHAHGAGGNATSPLHSQGSSTKGTKSELDASPLPSRGPKSGRKCYITPAFSGVPNKGTKSELAASPLPSRGPKSGWKCYITHAFSGIPNKGDKIKAQKKTKKNFHCVPDPA